MAAVVAAAAAQPSGRFEYRSSTAEAAVEVHCNRQEEWADTADLFAVLVAKGLLPFWQGSGMAATI